MNKRFMPAVSGVLLLSMACVPASFAGEGTAGDYFRNMGMQLGRGLLNVVSSPAEIPCTMKTDMKVQPAAGFFTGFGKGTVYMLRRILIGVSEVGTFILPREEASLPVVCTEPKA